MPAESREELVLAYLETTLASISGADYWYPPQRVRRVDGPDAIDPYFARADADGLSVFYLLWPEDEQDTLLTTMRTEKVLPISLLLARRATRVNQEADAPMVATVETPTRLTVLNRLLRDFDVKMGPDNRTLGGLSTLWTVASPGRNRQLYQAGWDVAQVVIEVTMQHPRDTP